MQYFDREQLAKQWQNRIAQARKPSGSQRASRQNTPVAPNPFAQQQQSMPTFQPPAEGGGGFNFTSGASAVPNPFDSQRQQQNGTGTPPPTSFQFGNPASQPTAQQNGGGMFGNNSTSFGSTFGASNAQPQQNGFNPPTSSGTGAGFSFGQTNPTQQNGATPSTNASFPTFGGTQTTENPFKNFGQSQQQTQSTPSTSFGGFGQSSQQQNGEKTPATPSFGGFAQTNNNNSQPQTNGTKSLFSNNDTPKTTTSSVFSSFGQQTNGASSQAQETPKATTSGIFSGMQQANTPKPLFAASTPPPEQSSNASNGVFLGLDSQRASTVKPGMFTSGQSETPKPPTNSFSFGQVGGQAKEQEAPKTNNLFGNIGQSQQSSSAPTVNGQQTPKASSNPFSGFQFGHSQAQQEDASMTTPGNTPQKQNLFAAQPISAPSETPAGQGKSLFDRVSSTPATAQKSFTPATSLFNPSTASSSGQAETPAAPGQGGLFDRITRDEAPPTTQKQTSFTPSTNLFNKSAASAAATPSAAPWLSHAPAAPQTTITPPTPKASNTSRDTSTQAFSSSAPKTVPELFKHLNEGLMQHLATEDVSLDWSTIMQYYAQKATEIRSKKQPSNNAPAPASTSSSSANLFASKPTPAPASSTSRNMFGTAAPKAPASTTSNMFGGNASQQTPKSSSTLHNAFNQPPATAPNNKKRSAIFEEDEGDAPDRTAPATEKRARTTEPINYPKLPDNASATAKLFQAALDKSTTVSPASTTSSGFRPPSSSGFAPSTTSTSAPTGMPTFSAPAASSGGFLSAFGRKASAEEENAKQKRKDEDYDSDDDETEWEKKDQQEQAEKRRKIEEAAKKAPGFVLPGSSRTPSVSEPETPMGAGKSLFDRVDKNPPATAPSKPSLFAAQAPAAQKATTNMFGSKTPVATSSSNIFGAKSVAHGEDAEKADETSNTTWNQSTPIKFGGSTTTGTESTTPAAPPPKLGSLFGFSAPTSTPGSTNGLLNIPNTKPALNFNFGGQQASSLAGSRATTPGVTTDGEGASTAGEDEDATPQDSQLEDLTVLMDEEKEKEDLLFSVAMAKATKWDVKSVDAETDEVTNGWVEKGKGPVYVLKNKETGKVRILLKIKPLGKAAMNFAVLEGATYEATGANGKMVKCTFVDHLGYTDNTKPTTWMVQVGKKEDAEALAGVLSEAAA